MTTLQTSAPAAEFDAAKARFHMIQQQIRPWDVADSLVLDTLVSRRWQERYGL